MSILLTDAELSGIRADFDSIFDTFSYGRTGVVVKEPIKTIVSSSNNNLFGFGDVQSDEVYSYEPVSGIFPIIVMYPKGHNSDLQPDINARIYDGKTTIKIKYDCKDYIQSGNTQYLLFDDKKFLIDGEPRRQMMLDPDYYLLDLKAVK